MRAKGRRGECVDGKETVLARKRSNSRPKKDYPDYEIRDPAEIGDQPDVLLDIPAVKVDEIEVDVEQLDARVALQAEAVNLVRLAVGVHAHLGQVKLQIKGVEAQALLKTRLHHVTGIVERVVTSLDRNPELIESLGRSVEEVGSGTGEALADTGEAVEEVGEGAGGAVGELGQGVGQLGQGG
jgi:hypothetical protein